MASLMLAFAACDEIIPTPDDGPDEEQTENNGDKDGDGKEDGKEDGKNEGEGENGESENGDGENGDGNGDTPPEDDAPLEPSAQKVRLETIAENVMDTYPADDFKDLFSLIEKFYVTYFEDVNEYYWDPLFNYCEERGEEMFFYTEEESAKGGATYINLTTEGFLEFSQLHGLITLGANSMTCEDYDGTKMVFDLDGDSYVVEVTPSGKTTTAKYTYNDVWGGEYNDGYWDEESDMWIDDYVVIHYNDKYQFEVEVPEKIDAVITKNGSDFATVALEFTQSFSKNGVDVTTDCFKVSATAEIDGHTAIVEKSGYDASTGDAYASFTLKKGSEVVLKSKASAKASFTLVTERSESESYYYDYTYPEFSVAKDFDFNIDVLGELQVKLTCTDGLKVADYVMNFYDAEDVNSVERAIDNINNYVTCGIYYDGTDVCQADVVMDYYVDKGDTYEWYELDPILVFPDGSKYAFYEYFDEEAFDGVIKSFDLWLEMYETMLDHYFGEIFY